MNKPFNPKYLWLLAIPLLAVLAYSGWGLAFLGRTPQEPPPETTEEPTTTPEESDESENSDGARATGDDYDDFGACEEDIENYCSGFNTADWAEFAQENGYTDASWKLGLVACLEANREFTSQACDDSLDRRAALNEDVNTACREDRAKYCQGVEPSPGSEPQIDCLKENYESLSLTCAEAVDAHEDAKPEDTDERNP